MPLRDIRTTHIHHNTAFQTYGRRSVVLLFTHKECPWKRMVYYCISYKMENIKSFFSLDFSLMRISYTRGEGILPKGQGCVCVCVCVHLEICVASAFGKSALCIRVFRGWSPSFIRSRKSILKNVDTERNVRMDGWIIGPKIKWVGISYMFSACLKVLSKTSSGRVVMSKCIISTLYRRLEEQKYWLRHKAYYRPDRSWLNKYAHKLKPTE